MAERASPNAWLAISGRHLSESSHHPLRKFTPTTTPRFQAQPRSPAHIALLRQACAVAAGCSAMMKPNFACHFHFATFRRPTRDNRRRACKAHPVAARLPAVRPAGALTRADRSRLIALGLGTSVLSGLRSPPVYERRNCPFSLAHFPVAPGERPSRRFDP